MICVWCGLRVVWVVCGVGGMVVCGVCACINMIIHMPTQPG